MAKPELRFKGFEGEWNRVSLSKIAKFSKGSGYSKMDLKDSGSPIILYGRLYTNYETVIREVDTFVTPKGNSVVSKGGEIIIPASGETPEDIACASVVENSGIILGGDLNVLSIDDSEYDKAFTALAITYGTIHNELAKMAQGKTVVHLHNSEISKAQIYYPDSAFEQQTIADYFKSLDSMIQATTKKIASLKQMKSASLISMFPQAGETTPRVRFKGFEREWVLHKIDDLLIQRNEQSAKSVEFPLKAFIAYKGVTDKGERYDRSALIIDVENKLYKRTYKGDFIYSSNNLESGSIGLNDFGKATISPVYSIFYCKDIADSDFIGYGLVRKEFIKEMVKWRQGVMYGQWRIHESDFLKISILAPTIEEQKKIGSYFRSLDMQISLQEQRLEKMKQIKAACLDKMFV